MQRHGLTKIDMPYGPDLFIARDDHFRVTVEQQLQ